MKTAIVFRTKAKKLKIDIEKDNYNEPDQVQFEICVFTGGKVAQRWLVGSGSMVWWDSLEDLYKVHIYSRPDYGTRVEWSSGEIEQL